MNATCFTETIKSIGGFYEMIKSIGSIESYAGCKINLCHE